MTEPEPDETNTMLGESMYSYRRLLSLNLQLQKPYFFFFFTEKPFCTIPNLARKWYKHTSVLYYYKVHSWCQYHDINNSLLLFLKFRFSKIIFGEKYRRIATVCAQSISNVNYHAIQLSKTLSLKCISP